MVFVLFLNENYVFSKLYQKISCSFLVLLDVLCEYQMLALSYLKEIIIVPTHVVVQ